MVTRRQNPDFNPSAVSRAAASPVDTFGGFQRAPGNSLQDLAEVLGRINPDVRRLAAASQALADDRDTREAERQAALTEARSWSEAVERGEVPAGASPVFQRAWRETRGKRLATDFGTQVMQDWLSPDNPERNTEDPQVFQRFLDQRRRAFLEGMDDDTKTGFLSRVGQYENQLINAVNGERIRRAEQAAEADLGALMMAKLREGRANPEAAIAAAHGEALGMRFAGMSGERINKVLAQAIISAAEAADDPRILDAAKAPRPDLTRPGQTIPSLASIPEFAQAFAAARTRINASRLTAENRAYIAEQRLRKERADQVVGAFSVAAAEAMAAGRTVEMPSPAMLRQIAAIDGSLPGTLLQIRNSFADGGERQSLEEVTPILFQAMRSSSPVTFLAEAMRAGQLRDPQRFRDLNGLIDDLTRETNTIRSSVQSVFRDISTSNLEGFSPSQRSAVEVTWKAAGGWAETKWLAWFAQYRQANGRAPTEQEALAAANQIALEARQLAAPWVQNRQPAAWNGSLSFPIYEGPQDGRTQPANPLATQRQVSPADANRLRLNVQRAPANRDRLIADFNRTYGEGAAEEILNPQGTR
jgi:hypothetical protein